MDEVLQRCRETSQGNGRIEIGVANAAKVIRMRRDPQLMDAVVSSDLLLADGMSIVWASRILGQALPERVAGIDLFEALLRDAEQHQLGVYCLGATDEVLERMVQVIQERHPRLKITGFRNGYYSPNEESAVAETIKASRPNYLFLGMTSPKKELFLAKWSEEIGANVTHGVGGSFDVIAGKVKRAPRLMQRLGLEWFYRLAQEPRRMFGRYAVTNTLFLGLVLRELLSGRRPAASRQEN